ncbi:RICIN domain-containing protein [Streptomyces sp. NPDC087294]|uniref:NHL domain-containing protein n=1 Tax=Streptomyces sp. NPDC087294 TaxID=3365777 RepID=UPI00382D3749
MSTTQAETSGAGRATPPISTVAGTGVAGFAGDDEAAIEAQLSRPAGVAVDSTGALYIADADNHRIRKIAADGTISTFAGTGDAFYRGDFGPAAKSPLHCPQGVLVDGEDALYLADGGNHMVRKVTVTGAARGRMLRVTGRGDQGPRRPGFGGDGGPAGGAEMHRPVGMAMDPAGVLYIADVDNHRIRRVTAAATPSAISGTISTFAGTGTPGFGGDNGPANAAQLKRPFAVAVGAAGDLYIADAGNHRIRRIAADGTISTIAGTGTPGFGGDNGPANAAQLNHPTGIVVDPAGVLYIADRDNHRVRKITADGTISTFAGTGTPGFEGDNGPANAAQLNHPTGLALDGEGVLYIADADNHRVRKITPVVVELPASGTVVFWANVRSRLRMSVPSQSTRDGAEIHQSLPTTRPHQHWRLIVAGQDNGHVLYTIENVRSGRVLEVIGAQETPGAIIAQRSYAGDAAHHQHWRLIPVDSAAEAAEAPRVYEIVNHRSGLPLRADTNPRLPIKQHGTDGDHRERQWRLLPV